MDLRVTYFREVLPVSKMIEDPGPPHLLFLSGPQTERVVDVEVNGVRGFPFTVSGDRTLCVELPSLFTVRSVAALGRDMGSLTEALIHVGFTDSILDVDGLQLLVQNYLKCFLTSPGSDVFSKKWGGGGNKLVGMVYGKEGDITTAAAEAVRRTTQSIMSRQMSNLTLPRSERLASAKMVTSRLSLDDQTFLLDIEIRNQEGRTVRAGLS